MILAITKPNASIVSATRIPLVFLHAYPLNSKLWRNQIDAFADSFNPIGLDFRGYGRSTVESPGSFSMALLAEDVKETLDAEGIEQVVFAGCSIGGYVIFELWRRWPNLFHGIIFSGSRAEADTPEGLAKRADQIKLLRERGADFMPRFVIENMLSSVTRGSNKDLVQEIMSWVAAVKPEVMIATLQALGSRPDSGPTLPTITVPTLVLVGEDDKVTPLPSSERMADEIPGAALRIIPNAGHLAPVENPKAVSDAMADFLKQLLS